MIHSRCWKLCLIALLSMCIGVHSASKVGATYKATPPTHMPPRGGWTIVPSGYNPLGYKITELGKQFIKFGDSLECDVGRFLASLKAHRKRRKAIKEQWLEIVRASKQGQSMRIYRELDNLLDFCLRAGLIN